MTDKTSAEAPGAGYSVAEAAAILGLSYVTVYRRMCGRDDRADWPGGRIGGKLLVSRPFVDALAVAIKTRPRVNADAFAAEWMARAEGAEPAGAVA